MENASIGKGLGYKFLKHIERTKIIFHLIACEEVDPFGNYKIVRREMANYNPALLGKPEYIFLSKSDKLTTAEKRKIVTRFKKEGFSSHLLSIYDLNSLKKVKAILNSLVDMKKTPGV